MVSIRVFVWPLDYRDWNREWNLHFYSCCDRLCKIELENNMIREFSDGILFRSMVFMFPFCLEDPNQSFLGIGVMSAMKFSNKDYIRKIFSK